MAKGDVLVRMKADVSNYDANIAKARGQLEKFKTANLSAGGAINQLSGTLVSTAARFASVTAAVGALSSAISYNIETARNFEKSMSQLSSLTGMVGDDLNKLKEYAIELGSTTTLSASQVADAFKLIGSQQPQLLASGEALKEVTKNAITLAEAAGIELADAAKTLSVSINQMGGDSGNAARFINVLAAASQKGAGDIVWLGEAITKSGTTAKAVGTDYEELVANLEQLAKAGYDASTAGTALRSIIMNLEKQANDQFKPSVVGLTQAFANLSQEQLTLTQYQEMTGKMFAAQAKALADAAGEAANMTEQITGTNIAEEQAKTNTDNLEGSIKALSSAWEGFNLKLNSSNGYLKTFIDFTTKAINSFGHYAFDEPKSLWDNPYNIMNPDSRINQQRVKTTTQGQGVVGGTYTVTRDANGNIISAVHRDATNGSAGSGSTSTKIPKGSRSGKVEPVYDPTSISYQQNAVQELTKAYNDASAAERDYKKQLMEEAKLKLDIMTGRTQVRDAIGTTEGIQAISAINFEDIVGNLISDIVLRPFEKAEGNSKRKTRQQMAEEYGQNATVVGATSDITNGVNGILSGIEQMGVEIPQELKGIMSGIQGVMTILTSINTILGVIEGLQAVGVLPFFARGGIVPHAANGYEVPGTHYSGDVTPIMANAGEVVLTRAQAGSLAADLQNGGGRSVQVHGVLRGEDIILSANRTFKRKGQGEIVTW